MKISLIVAAAENNAIGKNNQLLWHLPNDLKYFKNTTWGMPVIMGRKTFESISSEPLPGRINIIITRQPGFDPKKEDIWVVDNLDSAIAKAKTTDCNEIFIAGGGEIFSQAMSIADRIYMTCVHAVFEDAAVFFPPIDEAKWKLISNNDFAADEKHAFAYSFQVWERKK
jgi:dihydrofolate reductase